MKKDINFKGIVARHDEEDDTDDIDDDQATPNEKNQKKDPKANTDNVNGCKQTTQKQHKDETPMEDFVIDNIVDRKINESQIHWYAM